MEENIETYLKVIADKISKEILEQVSGSKGTVIPTKEYMKEEKEYFRNNTFYSEKHMWVKVTEEWNGKVGITNHAVEHLKNLAAIYTNTNGSIVRILEPFGVAETWLHMFDLYSPIAGKLTAINEEALGDVQKIDSDTWLIEVHPISHTALMKELDLLMNEKDYASFITKGFKG